MTTADELLARPVIPITVKPAAPKTAVLGVRNGCLHVSLKAAPVEGKANAELVRYLSKLTGKRCALLTGASSKKKLVKCG